MLSSPLHLDQRPVAPQLRGSPVRHEGHAGCVKASRTRRVPHSRVDVMIACMVFTAPPPDGPGLRAWSIFSVLLGNVLEMSFEQEFEGSPDGWWRVKFYKTEPSKATVVRVPAKELDTFSDDEISSLRSQRGKNATPQRGAERTGPRTIRMKVDLLAMEEPGKYVSDVTFERRRGKIVRRLQIRKRRPGERPPMIQ